MAGRVVTTTELAIHAYALHRGPIWRSDAWAAPDHHLHIEAPAMTGIDYRIGDTRDVTATIPTGSVSLVATVVHGERPDGMECAHSCGVRACVNPRHLRWDTHAGNCADKLQHGTEIIGERNPLAKLTADAVRSMRAMRAAGTTLRTIAEIHGVSRSHAGNVLAGRMWSHVEEVAQ